MRVFPVLGVLVLFCWAPDASAQFHVRARFPADREPAPQVAMRQSIDILLEFERREIMGALDTTRTAADSAELRQRLAVLTVASERAALDSPPPVPPPPRFTLFGDLHTSFTGKRAYLSSALLAGYIGDFPFELSHARVVAADDSAGTESTESSEEIRDRVSTVMRLVQNGGATTIRVVVPLLVDTGHAVHERFVQAYVDGGHLGQFEEEASDNDETHRLSAGLVFEGLLTWNIRSEAGGSGSVLAQLLAGGRAGWHWAGDVLQVDGYDRRHLTYGQVMVAVRQNRVVMFGGLVTFVPTELQDYMPKYQFNVSASVF